MTAGGRRQTADPYEVPAGRVARGTAPAPPSKSHTHRALLCAALAQGRSRIRDPLRSDDTAATRRCLEALGAAVFDEGGAWAVEGCGGAWRPVERPLHCGSSGTTLRLLAALLAASPGAWTLDGSDQLRARPLGPLAQALAHTGAKLSFSALQGHPPVSVCGVRWSGGTLRVDASASSQLVSGLLLAAPLASGPLRVEAEGLVSAPYAALTAAVMRRFGAHIQEAGGGCWEAAPGGYAAREETVEPDASAAAFLLGAAAVTGGEVTVPGLSRDSLQGDIAALDHLAAFGVSVEEGPEGATASGAPTRGADLDLTHCPDLAPPLAAVAFAAPGPSRLRGLDHLRVKESDRLSGLAELVRDLGGAAEVEGGALGITPPRHPRPADLDPRADHRMAMAGALMGLRSPGTRIQNPGCVSKSFPEFWEVLGTLLSEK